MREMQKSCLEQTSHKQRNKQTQKEIFREHIYLIETAHTVFSLIQSNCSSCWSWFVCRSSGIMILKSIYSVSKWKEEQKQSTDKLDQRFAIFV